MSKNSFIVRCWFWIFAWERMVLKNIISTLTETKISFTLFFFTFAQLLSFLSLKNQSLWPIDKYKLTKQSEKKLVQSSCVSCAFFGFGFPLSVFFKWIFPFYFEYLCVLFLCADGVGRGLGFFNVCIFFGFICLFVYFYFLL